MLAERWQWRDAARDCYLGWGERERIERLHLVANNERFLLLGSSPEKNLAPRILSQDFCPLSGDWERACGHPTCLFETLVDPGRFRGTYFLAVLPLAPAPASSDGKEMSISRSLSEAPLPLSGRMTTGTFASASERGRMRRMGLGFN